MCGQNKTLVGFRRPTKKNNNFSLQDCKLHLNLFPFSENIRIFEFIDSNGN